jgi:hypothetical protein
MPNAGTYARIDLIDRVQRGILPPELAEAEAARLGLRPLATTPDPSRFDPMGEVSWTPAMAVAWVAFRKPGEVREWSDAYRAECWDWHFRTWRIGLDGPIHEGYFLKQRDPATLEDVQLAATMGVVTNEPPQPVMIVDEAVRQLWTALQTGQIEATAPHGVSRRIVPAVEWQASPDPEANQVYAFTTRLAVIGAGDPAQVLFPRASLAARWPVPKPAGALDLPDLLPPHGAGPPIKTGAPGRPTSMHLIEAEFQRMKAGGEVPATLAETARRLEAWLKMTHPTYPPATATTIETRLRQSFREAKRPRK